MIKELGEGKDWSQTDALTMQGIGQLTGLILVGLPSNTPTN